ncbi:MAG: calcineurin-like phosphoesterase family protein [Candidatus Hydrogenedentota bacterium]
MKWKHKHGVAVLTVCVFVLFTSAWAQETARGVVFHDRNNNGARDAGEEGVPGVRVSNGRDIVATDDEGRYALPVRNDTVIFVLKPRDWMTPVDSDHLPRFHYIHKPEGSPDQDHPGVEPTGKLPEPLDFPLIRRDEPNTFKTIVFGDTQPRDLREVEYIAQDVVPGLMDTDAAFGITLGDAAFDNLKTLEPLNGVIGQIGIPWYNVVGNHDLNFDSPDNAYATETFQRVYGPPYYAFDYGPVHFVALNTVWWHGDRYTSRLGEEQLAFLKNDLEPLDREKLVVLLMHIPIMDTDERGEVYELLSQFPNRLILAGHWHRLEHFFLDAEDGWPGERPLHVLIPGIVCGGWWSGHHDEYGIPHATMYDGAPNGHGVFTFSGTAYRFEYVPARQPRDFQIAVYAPNAIQLDEVSETVVMANVFAGSERNTVEMRLGKSGAWIPMERIVAPDPNYLRLKDIEQDVTEALEAHDIPVPDSFGRGLPDPQDSSHLWRATLPAVTSPGTYTLHVHSTDMFGQTHDAYRIIRIE